MNGRDCVVLSFSRITSNIRIGLRMSQLIRICCFPVHSLLQDGTLKTWSTTIQESVSPVVLKNFGRQKDYLLKLSLAKEKQFLACVGLSGQFFLYDIQNLAQIADFSDRWEDGTKPSIYSVAVNGDCSFMAAGQHDGVIHILDQRDRRRSVGHLRGHTGCVRDVIVNRDARICVSASSDNTIRVWDLGQSRHISIYHTHSDTVTSLDASDDFNMIYSGGRDRCVYATSLNRHVSDLLLVEEKPVRSIRLGPDYSNTLWVSTTNPQVHLWPSHISGDDHTTIQRMGSRSATRILALSELNPLYVKPLARTSGKPGIVEQKILNNKRQILLKYSDNQVGLWDVTCGKIIENFGQIDFKQKLKELEEEVVVETWFKSEHKLGVLSFEIETPTCFKAEEYQEKLGYHVCTERKVNLGAMMLEGLFGAWAERYRQLQYRNIEEGESEEEEGDGSSSVEIQQHNIPRDHWGDEKTPLPFLYNDHGTSVAVSSLTHMGEPWLRQIWEFTGRESSSEIIPTWVADAVLRIHLPQNLDLKLSFYIKPVEGSNLQDISLQKLTAPKILQASKVGKYIADTLKTTGVDVIIVWQKKTGEIETQDYCKEGDLDRSNIQRLQISCKGQLVDPSMNLATIKKYLQKTKLDDDLILEYSEYKPPKNQKK
eukprot:TRINITY_DN8843_c0_g1_i3.p1 TRINITY_DN8843_c0_g1~~TRINITY_DN8843_c0_g1_i3.p1  ORF type:complete len:654 (-),score=82.24 TRINITY_DN8843_c0_g1_i3:233-2194(-)